MKTCTRCNTEYPSDLEHFPPARKNSNKLNSWCRACYKQRASDWYKKNTSRAKETMAHYYQANSDTFISRAAAWRADHLERDRELRKARYYRNPGPILALQARLRATNPEKYRAKHAKYAKENPEKRSVNEQRRRARTAEDPINDLTSDQWQEILIASNYRCVYCPPSCLDCRYKRHVLAQDHITPVAKGGSYTLANIVPACQKHNSSKNDGPVPKPVQPLLLTIAPSKPRRHNSTERTCND